ncbi:MAG: phage tail protein [Anaerolineaceae bacterium]|nr:phage tail protein [Anaerolineaceae bacterium]
MDAYIGEIRDFGFNFAPRFWLPCDGRLLQISEYPELFQLLRTTYGGDGVTTFGIPDLRGRVPLHYGHAPHLSNYNLGQKGGEEFTILKVNNIPVHSHVLMATSESGDSTNPSGAVAGKASPLVTYNSKTDEPKKAMRAGCISKTGDSQPNENRQPFLVTNICIACRG